ncbi:MAG: 3-oxoacyl-[acyl-carrier-protein] reductase, partial [Bacteroidota bacterium]
NALHEQLTRAGTEALAIQSDASDFEAADAVVQQVTKQWGRIDILVNNAGVTRDNLLLRMSEADWDLVLTTNLKSVFNFCKAVYRPMMRQRAGSIVNLSSVVGVMGNPGQANYSASKAGMIGFSKSLAKELGARGVRVNVVAPGYVDTDMTASLNDAAKDAMLGAVPLKRAAQPDDIANAVLFLASEQSTYITGHVLHVDGGLAM